MDETSADIAMDIYYHLYIGQNSLNALEEQAKKLVACSGSLSDWNQGHYAAALRFSDEGSLELARRVWEKYTSPDARDEQEFSKNLDRSRNFVKEIFGTGFSMTGLRSAAPLATRAQEVPLAFEHFWNHGTFLTQPSPIVNPLFAANLSENILLHYGTDPVLGFHLATAYAKLAPSSPLRPGLQSEGMQRVVEAARVQFNEWTDAFKKLHGGKLIIRFAVADALGFGHVLQRSTSGVPEANLFRSQLSSSQLRLDPEAYGEGGSAPSRFDVIDTTNLIDHLAALNLFSAAGPLLKDSAKSTLYMESLVKSSKTRKDQLDTLLRGNTPTISLLVGLAPVEYWTNATTISSSDELMLNAAVSPHNEILQSHQRLAWKLQKHFMPQSGMAKPLSVKADDLARTICNVYNQMFEHEDGMSLVNLSMEEMTQKMRNTAYPAFHRGSFSIFMKLVQTNVITDWPKFWELFLKLIQQNTFGVADGSVRQYAHELAVQLHMHGLRTEEWLSGKKPSPGVGRFHAWKNIPEIVCLTVVVPRVHIKHLYGTRDSQISAPTLEGILKSGQDTGTSAWRNLFSCVQLMFGEAEANGDPHQDDFSLSVRSDPLGWQGNSPMIAAFYVPAAALNLDPKECMVGLGVQSTISNLPKFKHLRELMTVYLTSISDDEGVFVSKFMPGMPGYPIDGTRTDIRSEEAPDDQIKDETTRITISANLIGSKTDTLCGRVDFLADPAKTLLTDKVPIELRQSAPNSIEIVFGKDKLLCPVAFPAPVLRQGAKTRIARKSSYIEIIAPLADPVDAEPLSSFLLPVNAGHEVSPVVMNGHHVNLDSLPIIDVEPANKRENSWLSLLCGHQFSLREKRLRDTRKADQAAQGISLSLRVNFKESLFTMMMMASSVQGSTTGLFGLSYRKEGQQLLMFVRSIRLDGQAGSIVADAVVLPLTLPLVQSGELTDFFLILRELHLCAIWVDEEELHLWKQVLAASVERCRTWSHKESCEYRKRGAKFPLSLKNGEQFLCGCGHGSAPNDFIDLPEWEVAAPYARRVAISPTFCVPYLEDVVDSTLGASSQAMVSGGAVETCRACGAMEEQGGKKLLRCSRCKSVSYCSAECQKKDWKKHRMECGE
ncbi:MYND finger [Xylariaceae sp. FL0016]|nr:MYND finger [Xylariaceae sp. FL0016]